jgi:hyperosmotically inducible periplasmic protein
MNQNQTGQPATATVVDIAAARAASTSANASQDMISARQESQFWTACALNPYLRASELKASVHNGKAILTGKVTDSVTKELAGQMALAVTGIHGLDNNIEVLAGYKPPAQTAERSFGELVDDATITFTVKSKLLWSRHGDGIKAIVDSVRGVVTVSGTADSAEAKDFAGRLAATTFGVRSVNNLLVVEAAKADVARPEAADITDGWITAKVKSIFKYSTNVDGASVAVNTNGGIVKLTGKMDSIAERAATIELAGSVRGVKSVDASSLTM